MTDDFDSDVDQWLDDVEGQLAPAGRYTPPASDDDGTLGTVRPQFSHLPTAASHGSAPGLQRSRPVVLESEVGVAAVGLERREAELDAHQSDLIRTDALVAVMKELVLEMRSVRHDVDQIKAVVGTLRRLTEATRRNIE